MWNPFLNLTVKTASKFTDFLNEITVKNVVHLLLFTMYYRRSEMEIVNSICDLTNQFESIWIDFSYPYCYLTVQFNVFQFSNITYKFHQNL